MNLESDFSIEKLRLDSPGCSQVIHLNNAGAGLMPRPVLKAIQDHLQLEAEMGGYEAARKEKEGLADAYMQVGKLLSCSAANIAFVASSTDAYAKALSSIPFQVGDSILTTQNDYSSNQLAFLSMKKRLGIDLLFAPEHPAGGVDAEAMIRLIDQHSPTLVAVTHVPTNSGLIQPVETIGAHCRQKGILYLVDACQSVGQMPLDVNQMGCDFLTASFRKFLRGPRGYGFLYVSDRVIDQDLEPLYIDLRGSSWLEAEHYRPKADATRYEFWEQPIALILGARACVQYAMDLGLEAIQERTFALAAYTREGLSHIPNIRVLDRGSQLCGIVTCELPGRAALETHTYLQAQGINTSLSYRENAVRDFDRKGVEWALRISPHYYNTYEEVDRCLELLREM